MFAAALTLGTAATVTLAHSLVLPTAAEASVLGKLKSTAKGIGAAAKAGAAVGKQVGKGVGMNVARAAKSVGGTVAKSGVGAVVKDYGRRLGI
jgi:hypothetical protein